MGDQTKPDEPHRLPVASVSRVQSSALFWQLVFDALALERRGPVINTVLPARVATLHAPLPSTTDNRLGLHQESSVGVVEQAVPPAEVGDRSAEANFRCDLDRAAHALVCASARCARVLPCVPARGVLLSPDQFPRRAPMPRCSRFVTRSVLHPGKPTPRRAILRSMSPDPPTTAGMHLLEITRIVGHAFPIASCCNAEYESHR